MTIERLQDLKREVERAITYCESKGMFTDMTREEASQWFIRAGAVPGVHHLIIGQFAITDLGMSPEELDDASFNAWFKVVSHPCDGSRPPEGSEIFCRFAWKQGAEYEKLKYKKD